MSVSLEGSPATDEPPSADEPPVALEPPNKLPPTEDLLEDALPLVSPAQEQMDIRMGIATAMQRMRKNKEFFIKTTILSFTLLYNKQILLVKILQPRLSGY